MQRVGQKTAVGVVDGDTRFIAGSLETEDAHRWATKERSGVSLPALPGHTPIAILTGSVSQRLKGNRVHAQRPRPRKRALRGRTAPLQAHDRKDRAPDRASRPRVLRKADIRAQAQESSGDQAPLQAAPQPAVAAEALLIDRPNNPQGATRSPLLF